jgi:hypothetical protein
MENFLGSTLEASEKVPSRESCEVQKFQSHEVFALLCGRCRRRRAEEISVLSWPRAPTHRADRFAREAQLARSRRDRGLNFFDIEYESVGKKVFAREVL